MNIVDIAPTNPTSTSASRPMGVDPVITIAEIAAWLQLAEPTLHRWVTEGKFPKGFKLGRTTRWKMSVVQAWIDRQEAEAAHKAIENGQTF